jgi:hypothetical protein
MPAAGAYGGGLMVKVMKMVARVLPHLLALTVVIAWSARCLVLVMMMDLWEGCHPERPHSV